MSQCRLCQSRRRPAGVTLSQIDERANPCFSAATTRWVKSDTGRMIPVTCGRFARLTQARTTY